MISKILHYKKAFEELKLLEHINNKLEAIKKIDRWYDKFLIIPMIIILSSSLVSCFVILASLLSLWYLSIPLIIVILTIFSANIIHPKLEKYLDKKYGKKYFEDNLINILQSIENQKVIVGYFNELSQRHNKLLSQYNELLFAFEEKDYPNVIVQLKRMLDTQQNIENNSLIEENKEIRIKDFKKSLGFEDNSEEELEIGGNFKKYL